MKTWTSFTSRPWIKSYPCCRQVGTAEAMTWAAIISYIRTCSYYPAESILNGKIFIPLSWPIALPRPIVLLLLVLTVLPSVSHAGESLTYQGSCIRFFGTSRTLKLQQILADRPDLAIQIVQYAGRFSTRCNLLLSTSHIPPRATFYHATQRKGGNVTTILATSQSRTREDLIPPV